MFIRQTRTNNTASGESYFTHRLVRSERVQGKVRQVTVLNLGRHFPFEQQDWPLLCQRIEQILSAQSTLLDQCVPEAIERAAQRYAGAVIARAPAPPEAESTQPAHSQPATPGVPQREYTAVDVNSIELSQPRSVGVEHLGLHALSQLGFIGKLIELGVNGPMRAAIIGNIIGRMARPGSELSTCNWLKQHSALGELLDVDFEPMPPMRLYRASDVLMKHRDALQAHVFSAVSTLFNLQETVTLYDLTNTYFEGQGVNTPKAKRGRSKEKRSDCPLVTLGLVLDGSGFVRRSKVFEGNIGECTTLQIMLQGLGAPKGALVVMDAGIATQANIDWLVEQGYRYLVVKRGGVRQFDGAQAVPITTADGSLVRIDRQVSTDGKEVHLYCHSEGREQKETGMVERFTKNFESGLQKIADGLKKPHGEKNIDKLMVRIGRLKQSSRGVSQHYTIELSPDADGKKATAISWKKQLAEGTMASHPGVYCLRSNEMTWDAQKLWRTYTMLTDLESVFRSLKSELGLRPVYHSSENRVEGHLFITVLAYQCVQVLRVQLKNEGIDQRWATLRETLSIQRRVTSSFCQADGRTLHVRKCTKAESDLMQIYRAVGVSVSPGGIKKMIV